MRFVLRQLGRRLDTLPAELVTQVGKLSYSEVVEFGVAMLDFRDVVDAQVWLSSLLKA